MEEKGAWSLIISSKSWDKKFKGNENKTKCDLYSCICNNIHKGTYHRKGNLLYQQWIVMQRVKSNKTKGLVKQVRMSEKRKWNSILHSIRKYFD